MGIAKTVMIIVANALILALLFALLMQLMTTPFMQNTYNPLRVEVEAGTAGMGTLRGTAIWCEEEECWKKGYMLANKDDVAVIFNFKNNAYTVKCFYNPLNFTIHLYRMNKNCVLEYITELKPNQQQCIVVEPNSLIVESKHVLTHLCYQ